MKLDECWWSPGQIRFRWQEVEWLLSHYTLISEGQWPPEPKNSGYAEIAGVVNLAKALSGRHKLSYLYGSIPACPRALGIRVRMGLDMGEGATDTQLFSLYHGGRGLLVVRVKSALWNP